MKTQPPYEPPPTAQQPTRHLRAQTYPAELTGAQVAEFGVCRAAVTWFYNEANASQLDRWRHGAGIESYISLTYGVGPARSTGVEFPCRGAWRPVRDVPPGMLRGALRQLAASWTRHLRMRTEGRPTGTPRFRSIHRGGSLYWLVSGNGAPVPLGRQITLTRKGTRDRPAMATIRVPGRLGQVAIRYHRELPADTGIKGVILNIDDVGRYWVTVQYDTAQVRQPAVTGTAGVDVGVMVTAATSDGEVYDAPGLSPGQQQRKDRLQRSMSRKRRLNPCKHDRFIAAPGRKHPKLLRGHCPPPGHPDHDCACWKHSARYARNKLEFLKLSQRGKRQRTHAAHLASRALAEKYATVVVEDLDVSAMTASAKGAEGSPGRNVRAKAGLNREILAGNWYQLRQFASYKTQVVTVPAPHTSQTCPACGYVSPENREKRDVFRCAACGLSGHADIVAAQNIRDRWSQTAAVQAVAAREICVPDGDQPANSIPNSIAEPDAKKILQPTGSLIPDAWGRPGARTRRKRRKRPPKQSRD